MLSSTRKRERHMQQRGLSSVPLFSRAVMKDPLAQPQRVSWQMNSSRQALIHHSRSRTIPQSPFSNISLDPISTQRQSTQPTSIAPFPTHSSTSNQDPLFSRSLTNGTDDDHIRETPHTTQTRETHLNVDTKRTLNHFFNVSFEEPQAPHFNRKTETKPSLYAIRTMLKNYSIPKLSQPTITLSYLLRHLTSFHQL